MGSWVHPSLLDQSNNTTANRGWSMLWPDSTFVTVSDVFPCVARPEFRFESRRGGEACKQSLQPVTMRA